MKRLLTSLTSIAFLLIVSCSGGSPGNTPVIATGNTITLATSATRTPTPGVKEMMTLTPIIPNTAGNSSLPAADCSAPASPTPALTEGPYYSEGSPERASLIEDLPGKRLVLTGYVLDTNCQPIPHAWLDFWQADSQGNYDNSGFTLRGHQFTLEDGSYQLETVVPGLYPGRTEHIHVKVMAPGGPINTTQLFFPGVTENTTDNIYNSNLLITIISEMENEIRANFNFVVSME